MRNLSLVLFLTACAGGDAPPENLTEEAPDATETVADAPSEDNLTSEQIATEMESSLDRSTQACDDFYQFACGGWLEKTELPADKARYTRSFTSIYDRNQEFLKDILVKAAEDPGDDEGMKKVGAVYGSCMDEAAVEKAGTDPLKPLLAQVDGITDLKSLSKTWGAMGNINVGSPLGASVFADFKDPDLNIMHMGQDGLGLPDRDYYLELDDDGKAMLADYQAHIVKMLVLAGASEESATTDAAAIVDFETKLATVHVARAELRDPEKNYHRIERAGAKALFTNLDLDAFFEGVGYDVQTISVERPEVYEATDKLLGETDIEVLKAYTRWHVVDMASNSLDKGFVDQNFAFYGKRLRGQQELRPRWKRCVSLTQGHLGDVLAQLYVDKKFAGSSKEKADEMILDIEHAFEKGLPELTWMDKATQERAVEKVGTLKNKIGYPKKWRDFSKLDVETGGHFDKSIALRRHTSKYWLDKVGNPVDKDEWFMSASDVNAYYNPLNNEMAFPAGILQPPFFHKDYPAALNYGAIGMVMGHELTHGFDDSGAKFAPDGKMVEWWAPEATEKFEAKTACVEKQYSGFEVLPGVNLNGKLTLGENIADLGGIKETHVAYQMWVEKHEAEAEMNGFSGEQQLFVAFAQGWCTLMTDEMLKERVATDSHSNAKWRVNGPLMNLPAFGDAFECEVGSAMRPVEDEICAVW